MAVERDWVGVFGVLWALLTALSVSPAGAQGTAARLARIDGLAFYSLTRTPLAGALVFVEGTGRSTIADSKGRFRVDSVPFGVRRLLVQHAAFDSVGLSGGSARVLVSEKTPRVTLGVPSFATLWRAMCGEAPAPTDSILVYGTVRDAGAGAGPLSALVELSWIDLVGGGASLDQIGQRRFRRSVMSAADGEYAICGVPQRVPLTVRVARVRNSDIAAAGRARVDTIDASVLELAASPWRVRRRDVLAAPAVASRSASPSASSDRSNDSLTPRPKAALGGVVAGMATNVNGAPMPNVAVSIDTMPEVRTGEDGRFLIRDVAPGTRDAAVMAIGFKPYTTTIDVMVGDTARLSAVMEPVQRLDEVKVRSTVLNTRLRDIEDRAKQGWGAMFDSTALTRYPSVIDVLNAVPNVRVVKRSRLNFQVDGCELGGRGLVVRLDNTPVDKEDIALLDPRDIALVEVYRAKILIPSELMFARGVQCVMMVWTKWGLKK